MQVLPPTVADEKSRQATVVFVSALFEVALVKLDGLGLGVWAQKPEVKILRVPSAYESTHSWRVKRKPLPQVLLHSVQPPPTMLLVSHWNSCALAAPSALNSVALVQPMRHWRPLHCWLRFDGRSRLLAREVQ
jgi:hypothetical protein